MTNASLNLGAGFLIRAKITALKTGFAVRQPYPYWTDRRYVNGVVSAAEKLLGDAKLEIIIEGVMDDVKIWLDAEGIIWDTWTDIDITPRAIKRATTYGVVAALYARQTKTFQGRVIPTVNPVSVVVLSEDEKAMNYWSDKMRDILEKYFSAQGMARLWVSTEDEEAIFSMDDIPQTAEEVDLETYLRKYMGQVQ